MLALKRKNDMFKLQYLNGSSWITISSCYPTERSARLQLNESKKAYKSKMRVVDEDDSVVYID
jgi:hypothetical protein